jgi:lysophospholipase L1-like esterase
MEHNHVRQPLIILSAVTTVLVILSFINIHQVLPAYIKPIDILADFKTTKESTTNNTAKKQQPKSSNTKKNSPSSALDVLDYTDEAHYNMSNLLQDLKNCNTDSTKIRIAYLGDSFIESDFITNDLRQLLQQEFGGNGIGFIPITSVGTGMRKSIDHSFSSNWEVAHLHDNKNNLPIGLSGYTFKANENSYCQYKSKTNHASTKLFYQTNEPTTITTNESDLINLPTTNNAFTAIDISVKDTNIFKINFKKDNAMYYGVSFEDRKGVYVDNFSFRGTNGTQLLKLDTNHLKAFNAIQAYQLIILHYGINVIGNNNKKLDWYRIGLNKTIQFVKTNFPHAAILLIGCSDKSTKTNGVYQTDEGIPALISLQQNLAQQNQIAFWNLYENMGGYNSMLQWVNGETTLAYKDYTHITFKGAQKIATMLYNSLTK